MDGSTRLLLVRHAHHDPGGRFLQHACPGPSPLGIAQAQRLAARLAAEIGSAPVAVLASMAARAIATAEIVADALGVAVAERTCDLCEVHPGAAEGLTQAEMEARFGPTYRDVPGAEWWPDWLPRAGAALDRIVRDYRGRTIVAASHSGVIRASFVHFGGMPPARAARVRSANTAITVWVCDDVAPDGSGRWRLDRHNDDAHLAAPPGVEGSVGPHRPGEGNSPTGAHRRD